MNLYHFAPSVLYLSMPKSGAAFTFPGCTFPTMDYPLPGGYTHIPQGMASRCPQTLARQGGCEMDTRIQKGHLEAKIAYSGGKSFYHSKQTVNLL